MEAKASQHENMLLHQLLGPKLELKSRPAKIIGFPSRFMLRRRCLSTYTAS